MEIKEKTSFETAFLSFLLTKKIWRLGVLSLFNNAALGLAIDLKAVQSDCTDILSYFGDKFKQCQRNGLKKIILMFRK